MSTDAMVDTVYLFCVGVFFILYAVWCILTWPFVRRRHGPAPRGRERR